jgi:hypothetical protein
MKTDERLTMGCALLHVNGLLEREEKTIIEEGEYDWTTKYEVPNPVYSKMQEVKMLLENKLKK